MGSELITGNTFGKVLEDAGIIPPNCRRFVIDVPVDDPVRIFYECFGDVELLDPKFVSDLKGIGAIRAKDAVVERTTESRRLLPQEARRCLDKALEGCPEDLCCVEFSCCRQVDEAGCHADGYMHFEQGETTLTLTIPKRPTPRAKPERRRS